MTAFYPKFIVENGREFAPTKSKSFFKLEVKCKNDENKQKGLFSKEPIKEGSIIARDGGVVLSSCEDMPEDHRYAVFIDDGLFLYPSNFENFDDLAYFNHSCASNVARIGGLIFVAKRDIEAGEELTLDYAPLVAGDIEWEMTCECGTPQCRGRITNVDWKNPEVVSLLWQEWLPHNQKRVIACGIL